MVAGRVIAAAAFALPAATPFALPAATPFALPAATPTTTRTATTVAAAVVVCRRGCCRLVVTPRSRWGGDTVYRV